ncbi:MAG: hypothetical protein ABSC57_11550 [Syntrophales bacterium]
MRSSIPPKDGFQTMRHLVAKPIVTAFGLPNIIFFCKVLDSDRNIIHELNPLPADGDPTGDLFVAALYDIGKSALTMPEVNNSSQQQGQDYGRANGNYHEMRASLSEQTEVRIILRYPTIPVKCP